jgi:subtilisin family serine protease
MRRWRLFVGLSLCLMLLAGGSAAAPAPSAERASYIVVFHQDRVDDVPGTAAALARAHGGQLGFVYQHALEGFSVQVSSQAAAALARNPLVAYVEKDQVARIAADASAVAVPTGIDRVNADQNTTLDIDGVDDLRVDAVVAVIDTGVDFQHSDLNVNTTKSVNCSGGSPFKQSCGSGGDDDNGHGTHVAGTIGALDNGANVNGIHVVGVAPGAEIWSVKVLRSDGSGYISWIVAGIDYVTANAASVDVANMSLGCECSSAAMDDAIARSVDAGVAYAVAAGNSAKDASTFSPANHPDVITVSALADFDGEPEGLGSPTCRDDQDDTLADFSNYGATVEVTAPGVCILSTWHDGGYHTISGTSMASPHAAGAAALLATSGTTDPQNIRSALISSGNTGDWTDEKDGNEEPRIDVATFSPAMVGSDSGGGGTNSSPTASFTYTCTDLSCSFDGSGSTDSDGTIASYAWDFGDGATATGVTASHSYAAGGTYTVTLTVTDDDGATDSSSQDVSVTEGSGGSTGPTLAGSSTSNGPTWTATVTLTGSVGDKTSGTWDYDGSSGHCEITSGSSCSFSLSGIPKRVSSVTYTDDPSTDGDLGSVTITKP